jgi:CRP-like cAMP-binding protein
MALVDQLPRSASALASEDSAVIEVDQKRFLAMIQQSPMFAIQVMRVLTLRLRAMNERL